MRISPVHTPIRTWVFAALMLALAVSLTGCTVGSGHMASTPRLSEDYRADVHPADVQFLNEMLPLHRQSVRMSRMAQGHGASPRVRALAERMMASQSSEIGALTSCRTDWGRRDEGPSSMMQGSPMMSGAVSGMMSGARMKGLATLHHARFDERFLTMMAAHHRASITKARTELDEGVNPRARKLARMIEREQSAELQMMHDMSRR